MDTVEKLNRLAQMQAQTDTIRTHFETLREQAVPPEVKQALDDITAEEKTALDALQSGIASLTDEVKAEVLQAGTTIKGDYLQAVWSKGRVSWDTKSLDGYAAAHPELARFRKEGEPSVAIRALK